VPEAGAAPVSQELLPPLLVRQGPGPALEESKSRQYWRIPACGGNSENSRFSCSSRPSGCAWTDWRIFGPNDIRVLTPLGSLTLIPGRSPRGRDRTTGRPSSGSACRVTGQPSTLIAPHRNPSRARTASAVGQAPYQGQSGRSYSDLSVWPPHAGEQRADWPFLRAIAGVCRRPQPYRTAVHACYTNHASSLCAAAWRWSGVYASLVRSGKGPGKRPRQ
jgi:hypothetical protein